MGASETGSSVTDEVESIGLGEGVKSEGESPDEPSGSALRDGPGAERSRLRVLALLSDCPMPPRTGSAVRNAHLWPRVARQGEVEVRILGLDLLKRSRPGVTSLQGLEAEFMPFEPRTFMERVRGAAVRSWHEYPRSQVLAERVDELVTRWRPDVIHAEELRMAAYLPGVRGRPSGALESLTLHNVESELFARAVSPMAPWPFREFSARLQRASLRRYEATAVARVGLRLAYSEQDRRSYEVLYPGLRWASTRNGTDVEGVVPAPQSGEPNVLLLASWAYAPNREGLRWFLREVLPRLDPSVRVTLAGSGMDRELREWVAGRDIALHDSPTNLGPIYAEAAAVAVPLFEGSGTRGKILEALAHERLIVTTSKGPEGLHLGPEHGITIADDPQTFADALSQIVRAPGEQRVRAARLGREAVRARYDWNLVARELVETWRSCKSR